MSELYRTEEYLVIVGHGDLGDHGTTVIGNAAYSGKYNPIPGMIEHLLRNPNKQNAQLVKFNLMRHFVDVRLCSDRYSADVADDVLRWYLDPHCHSCHGTGKKNREQEVCPVCNGIPKRPTYDLGRKGLAEIESLFVWREKQLRKRNGNDTPKTGRKYTIPEPLAHFASDCGIGY